MTFIRTTLRQQVQDALRKEILQKYKAGDRLPGERRLAEHFGVSIITLREALQGLAELKLIERHQGLGTIVLDIRERYRQLPVGVLVDVDVTHPNTSPIQAKLAVECQQELHRRGHEAVLFFGSLQPGEVSSEPTSHEVRRALEEHSIKALIVITWTTTFWQEKFEAVGIPIIRLGGDCPCGVRVDSAHFIVSAIDNLVNAGCRRLALISWEGRHAEYSDLMSEPFRAQLERRGLPVRKQWISTGIDPNLSGAGWEAFREIWLAGNEKPDGLVVSDDMLLRGVLMATREFHVQIPEQLKLAKLSDRDSLLAALAPGFTYEIPVKKIIDLCVDFTEARLADPQAPVKLVSVPAVLQVGSGLEIAHGSAIR